ncbi:helix-turn-helix domain-containing protein [Sphaerotilus mobilis]|uniref:CRP-like cAMP-binding protein n=1 Tax=Sphaerotilus mobilis TaxID=47994 RepID=A0A4V2EWR3_9BURK|nr:Crp/Fnr family transcriptional regulator [Sphaerotilus mobilis]RZS56890.1 CRP-like cAMP-binding protein [Sphaerotilus mobilis]
MNPLHVSSRPLHGLASASLHGQHGQYSQYGQANTRSGGYASPAPERLPARVFLRAGEDVDGLRSLTLPHVLLSGHAISRRPIDEPEDLQLLQPGDLVGLESFQMRVGERRIQALTDCELAPLRRMSDAEWRELLLHALLRRDTQAGLAHLRVGSVGERVRRLLLLLTGCSGPGSRLTDEEPVALELPSLATIAAITASTNETVCRVVSHFRRTGLLEDVGNRKVRLMPGLLLSAGELPGGVTRSRTR